MRYKLQEQQLNEAMSSSHPCLCDKCLKARDTELQRLRQYYIEKIRGMKESERTWGKFFKGTSFEHKNDKHTLDIKCAYTNGYNQAISDILSMLEEAK